MNTLFIFLFLISLLCIPVFIVWALINLARKQPAKKRFVTAGVSFLVCIGSLIGFGVTAPDTQTNETAYVEDIAEDEVSADTAEDLQAEEPSEPEEQVVVDQNMTEELAAKDAEIERLSEELAKKEAEEKAAKEAEEKAIKESETNAEKETAAFIKDVSDAIQGAVGKGEQITDIKLENRDLCVYVDLGDTSSVPISPADIARSRTSYITDDILTLDKYDSLWDTVTIDFGEIGYIKANQNAIQENGYGRFFAMSSNDTEDALNDQAANKEKQSVAKDNSSGSSSSANTSTPAAATSEPASDTASVSSGDGNNFNTYDNAAQQQTEATYVLNTSRMKIHYPSCGSVKKIAPKNYSTSNSSVEELISQGYSTCGICFK